MTSTSVIRFVSVLLFSMFTLSIWCQELDSKGDEEHVNSSMLDYGVKGFFGVAYNVVNPSGDKYFGLAYKGQGGYAINFKLFVYDGFFLGGSSGFSYFENTNIEITGNYDKTRVGSHYLFLGYEYRPIEKLAFNVNASLFGEARHKNEYNTGNEAYQVDKSKIRAFEVSLDYFVVPNFSINVYYTYRNDKNKIKTSPDLQSRFDRAQFSIIGLGLNFQFGKEAIISSFSNKK